MQRLIPVSALSAVSLALAGRHAHRREREHGLGRHPHR